MFLDLRIKRLCTAWISEIGGSTNFHCENVCPGGLNKSNRDKVCSFTCAVSFLGSATCSGSPRVIIIPGTFGPGVDISKYWNNFGSLSKSDWHFLEVLLWQQHYTVYFLGHTTCSGSPDSHASMTPDRWYEDTLATSAGKIHGIVLGMRLARGRVHGRVRAWLGGSWLIGFEQGWAIISWNYRECNILHHLKLSRYCNNQKLSR